MLSHFQISLSYEFKYQHCVQVLALGQTCDNTLCLEEWNKRNKRIDCIGSERKKCVHILAQTTTNDTDDACACMLYEHLKSSNRTMTTLLHTSFDFIWVSVLFWLFCRQYVPMVKCVQCINKNKITTNYNYTKRFQRNEKQLKKWWKHLNVHRSSEFAYWRFGCYSLNDQLKREKIISMNFDFDSEGLQLRVIDKFTEIYLKLRKIYWFSLQPEMAGTKPFWALEFWLILICIWKFLLFHLLPVGFVGSKTLMLTVWFLLHCIQYRVCASIPCSRSALLSNSI